MDSVLKLFESGLLATDLKSFFSKEFLEAAEKCRFEFSDRIIEYVIELLVQYQDSDRLFGGESSVPVLSEMLAEALEAEEIRKIALLKQMGDTSLVLSGFFPEALERRCMNSQYYQQMGETAYYQLGVLHQGFTVFDELSECFKPVCSVLNEVSEKSQERNYSVEKLLMMYRNSESERILEKLKRQGIIPIERKPS